MPSHTKIQLSLQAASEHKPQIRRSSTELNHEILEQDKKIDTILVCVREIREIAQELHIQLVNQNTTLERIENNLENANYTMEKNGETLERMNKNSSICKIM